MDLICNQNKKKQNNKEIGGLPSTIRLIVAPKYTMKARVF